MKSFLSTKDCTLNWLERLFENADSYKAHRKNLDPNKIVLFAKNEASTRTRVSFEVATKRLGARFIEVNLDNNISLVKGETIKDTLTVLSQYADVLVLRHSDSSLIKNIEWGCPIINAGNGDEEHPTQALQDVYTIQNHFRAIEGLEIALVGDLKYSRTIHSLLPLLNLYSGIRLHLVAPEGLELPNYQVYRNLDEVPWERIDVVYLTREQKERYWAKGPGARSLYSPEYFIFSEKYKTRLNARSILLHPLPRCEELPVSWDSDPRSLYLKEQVQNGVFVRMALLEEMLYSSCSTSKSSSY